MLLPERTAPLGSAERGVLISDAADRKDWLLGTAALAVAAAVVIAFQRRVHGDL